MDTWKQMKEMLEGMWKYMKITKRQMMAKAVQLFQRLSTTANASSWRATKHVKENWKVSGHVRSTKSRFRKCASPKGKLRYLKGPSKCLCFTFNISPSVGTSLDFTVIPLREYSRKFWDGLPSGVRVGSHDWSMSCELVRSQRRRTLKHCTLRQIYIDLPYIQYNGTIRYDTIRYDTIRYDTIRYDMIWYDMMLYDVILYDHDMIRYDMIYDDRMRYDSRVHDSLMRTICTSCIWHSPSCGQGTSACDPPLEAWRDAMTTHLSRS